MKTRLFIKVWENIRTSFWFVPTLMAVGSALLFVATISLDYRLDRTWANSVWYIYSGGPEGALSLLSTVAGSMITVTGVVFSITIVAFTLASSQFSPRLLRNYMRDLGNQVTLGSFIGTFLYCVLVLRTVKAVEADTFVPHVSLTVAGLLALCSLAVLIYFIHHASSSIQAEAIITQLGWELEVGAERLFPETMGEAGKAEAELTHEERAMLQRLDEAGETMMAQESRYLQAIDRNALMDFAQKHDVLLRVFHRPGNFILKGEPLVRMWPKNALEDESALRDTFVFGQQRTDTQDYEFLIQQIVEVGLRALSPSLNDPFTACSCIDRLAAALVLLAQRTLPPPYRMDKDLRLRVAIHTSTFPSLLDAAFHQLRQATGGSVAVLISLLRALAGIANVARRKEDAEALLRHGEMILRASEENVPERKDRADVLAAFTTLRATLDRREWTRSA